MNKALAKKIVPVASYSKIKCFFTELLAVTLVCSVWFLIYKYLGFQQLNELVFSDVTSTTAEKVFVAVYPLFIGVILATLAVGLVRGHYLKREIPRWYGLNK